ncbi:hypothetical protein NUW58_g1864 [Xylaria curta]|uniref:Uncharacterized protein n=1 Tax=Xylaria curta TaxID=42375 RepID=A0ACC1PKT7_9PEZI|nr:hypothetical protein NUW58_g1864 [Xylaria curta]
MSRRNPKLSDQQWDDHKALIREWYIVQDKPLKEVHSKLKEQGLEATTHQIETKLKKWKFRKNVDKQEWISIDRLIAKRKRDGRESEVILCGKRMKPETVTRETDRHGDRSTLAQLGLHRASSPLPLNDCQVAVCTPQSINFEFEWPTTLPWLRFSLRELPRILKACQSFALQSQNASSSNLVSAILPKTLRTDMAHIGVSQLAAIIGKSMPEKYPQENLQRAQSLVSRSAEDSIREYLSIIIYNVSNNVLNLLEDDRWEEAMKVLEECGIFRLNIDIGKDKSPTINGFMEKLFMASITRCLPTRPDRYSGDSQAETVAKWLVTSGYCSNTAARTLWTEILYRRPSNYGTQKFIVDCTKHLLDAGVSANITVLYREGFETILEIALQQTWCSGIIFDLAKLLFKHGASKNLDRATHFAIRREETDLVEMIVQHGADLTANMKPLPGSPVHKETALTVAASMGLRQTLQTLERLSILYPLTPLTTFITPDVFVAAAAKEQNDVIRYLYKISPNIMADEDGITPLFAAARWGHLSTCQLLLHLQAASNTWTTARPSPVHAACYGGHKEVVELLIRNGANVRDETIVDSISEEYRLTTGLGMYLDPFEKRPLKWLLVLVNLIKDSDRWGGRVKSLNPDNISCCVAMLIRAGAKLSGSKLYIAARACHLELLAAVIEAGANPNGLDEEGKTALQCALGPGCLYQPGRLYGVVSYLLSRGAQLLGGEVDSAVVLERWEVASLLIQHGGELDCRYGLERAILAGHDAWTTKIFEIEPRIYSAGALFAAIATKNDSLVRSLILNRPAKTSDDPLEITAIATAVMSGNLVLLQDLLAHPPSCRTGPLPLVFSRNPPIISMRSDATEACSRLLGSGFRADELTWVMAAAFNNTAFIQTLLEHGQHYGCISHDHRIPYDHPRPLEIAAERRDKGLAALLLKAGVDVNDYEPYIGRPLLAAVITGDLDMVDYFIQAGADVNAYGGYRVPSSPLQEAVRRGKTHIVHRLVQAGANVNNPPADDGGATALQFAAIGGHLGLAKYLIDQGAQVNAPPARRRGRTALQGAAEHGRLDILEFLLAEGALTSGRWRRRFVKAVKLAIEEDHYVAADLLKQSAGWSQEDEDSLTADWGSLLYANPNSDTESEGDSDEDTESESP